MTMIVASVIFVILLAVAIAHLLWAIGSPWPIRDPELLARTVVGRPGITHVPKTSALLRGALALAAGIFALALADHTAGGLGLSVVGLIFAALFIGRGILGYTAGWRARFPVEPYATLDRRNYSPLFLIVGAGFAILLFMRLI